VRFVGSIDSAQRFALLRGPAVPDLAIGTPASSSEATRWTCRAASGSWKLFGSLAATAASISARSSRRFARPRSSSSVFSIAARAASSLPAAIPSASAAST
jgi:hypothetical protein